MKPDAPNQANGSRLRGKSCWQCGIQFKTSDRYQNWCSADCEKEYQKNPIDYPTSLLFSEGLGHSVRTSGAETDHDGSHFAPFGATLGDTFKEVQRRIELRQRTEAERGGPISDEEFLRIADASGIKL